MNGDWIADMLVVLLAVMGLGGDAEFVVVAGVSESGGLVVVGVVSIRGAMLSMLLLLLKESSSLLLKTAAAATSHVGSFHVAVGC